MIVLIGFDALRFSQGWPPFFFGICINFGKCHETLSVKHVCLLIIGHCFYSLEGLEENDFAKDGKPCPQKLASCKKILNELVIRIFFL